MSQPDEKLVACEGCHRHFRVSEPSCPHCGCTLRREMASWTTRRVFIASAIIAGGGAAIAAIYAFARQAKFMFQSNTMYSMDEGKVADLKPEVSKKQDATNEKQPPKKGK